MGTRPWRGKADLTLLRVIDALAACDATTPETLLLVRDAVDEGVAEMRLDGRLSLADQLAWIATWLGDEADRRALRGRSGAACLSA